MAPLATQDRSLPATMATKTRESQGRAYTVKPTLERRAGILARPKKQAIPAAKIIQRRLEGTLDLRRRVLTIVMKICLALGTVRNPAKGMRRMTPSALGTAKSSQLTQR